MARRERFLQYTLAHWPDEELRAAAASLTGLPVIFRSELSHRGATTLTVDFSDNHYYPPNDPDAALNPGSHHQLLRLEWGDLSGDGTFGINTIFALESYDEFYSGPFLAVDGAGLSGHFYEVVNDPNPWIVQILEDNHNTDTFPPYGEPALMSERTRQLNPHLRETGRFFAPDAPLESSGRIAFHYWAGSQPPTSDERAAALAEAKAKEQARWEEQKRRPRYRHLIIASESHFLEILCEDLPRWSWVGAQD